MTEAARGRRGAGVAIVALAVLAAGCAGRLADLEGSRSVTEWIPAAATGASAEVPVTFVLRNRSLGGVRVESVRVPISTVVECEPRLPATVPAGGELRVMVTGRFWPAEGNRARAVQLECAGQPPLELTIDGRVRPVAPSDAAPPQAISPSR